MLEVLDLVGMTGQVPAIQGTELPLVDSRTPRESAAADAIIAAQAPLGQLR